LPFHLRSRLESLKIYNRGMFYLESLLRQLKLIFIILFLFNTGCLHEGYFNPVPQPGITVLKPEISLQQASQECQVIARNSAVNNGFSQNPFYLGFLETELYGDCMNRNGLAFDL